MNASRPLEPSQWCEKSAQTLQRLREFFGEEADLTPFYWYANVPAFLYDFYMNAKRFIFSDGKLDVATKELLALVVARTEQCEPWGDWLMARRVARGEDAQRVADAIAVAATCSMYNGFFKFREFHAGSLFVGMPVGLRATTFSNTGLDEGTVELINIVVSNRNGCKPCVTAHVDKARSMGFSDESILEAVQCAATMLSGAMMLSSLRG